MDGPAIERMFQKITDAIDGEDYESIMIVMGAVHNALALRETLDEDRLRSLYNMMGEAAVCLATLEYDSNQLQAEKNSPQKTERKKARKTSGNEPGPSGPN